MSSINAIISLALTSVIVSSASAKSEVKSFTKNGKSYVIATGRCSMATEVGALLQSKFTYTVCQEKITQDYNVTSSDQWYNWKSTKEAISGTEVKTYVIEQVEKGATQVISQDSHDLFADLSVQSSCQTMQNLVSQTQLQIKDTPCGQQ